MRLGKWIFAGVLGVLYGLLGYLESVQQVNPLFFFGLPVVVFIIAVGFVFLGGSKESFLPRALSYIAIGGLFMIGAFVMWLPMLVGRLA